MTERSAARRKAVRRAMCAGLVAAAVSTVAVALLPATAGAAAPRVKWLWTMIVSPSSPKMLLVGTNDGLYRSRNGGETWHRAGLAGVNATSVVQTGNTIFAGGVRESPEGNPIVARGHDYYIPPGQGVLAASSNGGASWQVLHPRGLPHAALVALAVAPRGTQALYALLRTGALYRSTDGARSFQLVSAKIPGTVYALAVTKTGHFVEGDMTTGSYVSANGKRWQLTGFTDARGGRMVMEYAVQPSHPTHVVMTAYGIVMSTDSGKTWHTVLKSNVMFGPVAWAPSRPDTAYAIGWDRSVWRTDDGGKHWRKVA